MLNDKIPTYEQLKQIKEEYTYSLYYPIIGGYFRLKLNEDGRKNIAIDYLEGGYLALDVNNNVSTTKFSEIIKFIFIRFNANREKNNQDKEQIRISHKLSDNLLALAKFGIGKNKVLKSKDIKNIKNLNNKEDIFKFILFKNKEDDE